MLYICEGQILDETYTLISDDYVEITWNVLVGTSAWELFGGHGVCKVEFSGNKMTLQGRTRVKCHLLASGLALFRE